MSIMLLESPTYTLDGLTLNSTDSFGVEWIVTEETGWSDAAPIRLTTADREDAHGGVSGPVWRGARLISLKGTAIAGNGSRYTMLQAKDRLREIADDGAYELLVVEEHMTRVTTVKQFAECRIRDRGSFAFEWELSLRADDPLRYAPVPQTLSMELPTTTGGGWVMQNMTWPMTLGTGLVGGSKVADNYGTAPVYAVLTIAGPLTNPTVTNVTTGQLISLALAVNSGEQLVIDMATHSVRLSGANRFDALTTTSSWWQLVPGFNDLRFDAATGATGTPLATVTYRPAWR
jgi:hypothetical protein